MTERVAWVNGRFVAEREASVSIFDRGFLFGDGVYDVATIVQGRLLDADLHVARLERSCRLIALELPYGSVALCAMMQELAERNREREGLVYVQVTRGVAERDFAFPKDVAPTVIAFVRPKALVNDPNARGVRVITTPDIRWTRRDIKSTSLLAQVLAKQQSREANTYEAFMHDQGVITEGSSCNAWMVKNGTVLTRALSHHILAGITRHVILELARSGAVAFEERAFTIDELLNADEAFLTSATNFLLPVVAVDGRAIGDGAPGPITLRLRELYVERALALTSAE